MVGTNSYNVKCIRIWASTIQEVLRRAADWIDTHDTTGLWHVVISPNDGKKPVFAFIYMFQRTRNDETVFDVDQTLEEDDKGVIKIEFECWPPSSMYVDGIFSDWKPGSIIQIDGVKYRLWWLNRRKKMIWVTPLWEG